MLVLQIRAITLQLGLNLLHIVTVRLQKRDVVLQIVCQLLWCVTILLQEYVKVQRVAAGDVGVCLDADQMADSAVLMIATLIGAAAEG